MLKETSRLYFTSWVRDFGPDLHPNDYTKNAWSDDKSNELDGATKQKEPSKCWRTWVQEEVDLDLNDGHQEESSMIREEGKNPHDLLC